MAAGAPSSLIRAFRRDLRRAPETTPAAPAAPVTHDDVAELPDTVRRYFSAMGVVGRPPVRSFGVGFAGRFRRGGAGPWMPCHALQYNLATPITRIYTLRVVFRRVIPMIGHDTYLAGRGRMVGKIAGLVTVADGSGEPFDVGELVTYLNDAILLVPSMLLGAVTWTAVDDASFAVSLHDHGRTVTGHVLLDARGLPVDFRTTDRFYDSPDGPIRREWRTPVASWDRTGPQPFPGPARATWLLPEPFPYAEGQFLADTFRRDVVPRDT